MLNCLFVRDVLGHFPYPKLLSCTRHVKQNCFILNQRSTDIYGTESIQHQSALAWNKLQKETNQHILQNFRFKQKSTLIIKS